MNIGKIIKKLRESRDLSQAQLADKGNIPRSYISRLESEDYDAKDISLATYIKLSVGLDMPLADLMTLLGFIEHKAPASTEIFLRNKYHDIDSRKINRILGYIDSINDPHND